MALKKVKGNLERMFDKNLTDLVRGIRNNKENEVCLGLRLHSNTTKLSFLFSFLGQIHCTVYGRHQARIAPRQFVC